MKIIFQEGTAVGIVEGNFTQQTGLVYVDPPENFDLTKINDYTLVNGQLTLDPTASLTRAKLTKVRSIRAHFDDVMQGIKASAANYEVLTWDTQRNELTMYLANNANPTPYVDSLAAARGESREDLFTKIKAKVDAMAALQGTQHLLEKQVESATTLAEVEAVKWA